VNFRCKSWVRIRCKSTNGGLGDLTKPLISMLSYNLGAEGGHAVLSQPGPLQGTQSDYFGVVPFVQRGDLLDVPPNDLR
ncbi:hypothetical protein, partial [Cupriavidus metallidurans]|uniref:hypothetical protein n=1 Tax=Cupriavidus metallidurans TaxID=119219 RepID=UPI001BDBDDE8